MYYDALLTWLGTPYLGTPFGYWIGGIAMGVILACTMLILKRMAKHWSPSLAQQLLLGIHPIYIAVLAWTIGAHILSAPQHLLIPMIMISTLWGAVHTARLWHILLSHYSQRIAGDQSSGAAVSFVSTISTVIIWIFALLILFAGLGLNITTLITGLGIGGIAMALAVQNILGDLFSFFAIHFDKPCKEGDMIAIGGVTGTVKKIGLRTTRMKATTGEEVVLSNKEITTAHIHNFKKADKKRVICSVVLGTTDITKQHAKLLAISETIVQTIPAFTLHSCYLTAADDTQCTFELLLRTNIGDFGAYSEHQSQLITQLYTALKQSKYTVLKPITLALLTPGS